jgi:hypothetical protein
VPEAYRKLLNRLDRRTRKTGGKINKLKQTTLDALLKAYAQLHQITEDLYEAHDNAVVNNDDEDASLLVSRADRLYEEVENLELVISELEEK